VGDVVRDVAQVADVRMADKRQGKGAGHHSVDRYVRGAGDLVERLGQGRRGLCDQTLDRDMTACHLDYLGSVTPSAEVIVTDRS